LKQFPQVQNSLWHLISTVILYFVFFLAHIFAFFIKSQFSNNGLNEFKVPKTKRYTNKLDLSFVFSQPQNIEQSLVGLFFVFFVCFQSRNQTDMHPEPVG